MCIRDSYNTGFSGGLEGDPRTGTGALGTTIVGQYRESFECTLNATMLANNPYTVEFYVKYHPNATYINNFTGPYPTFGIYFYNSATTTPSWFFGGGINSYCNATPQLTFPVASITTSYQLVSFTYTPTANYNRMIVGYFGGAGEQQRYLNYDDFNITAACTPPTTPTSASNSVSCPGAGYTLSRSGGSLGTGGSWKWYTGSCGGSLVGTGSSISVSPALSLIHI